MPSLIAELSKIASVFGVAFLSLWAAIPTGLALGLEPVSVASITAVSYASGVLLVLLVGKPVHIWLVKRLGLKTTRNPDSPLWRAWDRFGIAGFGLLAPMLVGAQGGTVIGLALGVPPRRLIFWMTVGGILWAAIITVVVVAGVLTIRTAQ